MDGFLRKLFIWISAALIIVSYVIPVIIFWAKESSGFPLVLEEVDSIIGQTIEESQEEFQSSKIQNYMYDGSNYTNNYLEYLSKLNMISISNGYADLTEVVSFLKNGNQGVNYTPLNFDFAYLDLDVLNEIFKENLNKGFNDSLANNNINGTLGDKIGLALIGTERYKLINSEITCLRFDVYDITNISQNLSNLSDEENKRRKEIYYSIYGTTDPNACTLRPDIVGVTDRKYLVVYTLEYTIDYRVYFTSEFARIKPGSDRETEFLANATTPRNSMGYLAYPDMTNTYQDLYYIIN